MKLDALIKQLDQIKMQNENGELSFPERFTEKLIIQLLLNYIDNKTIEEKINEIPF
jgi:hypothetical protein